MADTAEKTTTLPQPTVPWDTSSSDDDSGNEEDALGGLGMFMRRNDILPLAMEEQDRRVEKSKERKGKSSKNKDVVRGAKRRRLSPDGSSDENDDHHRKPDSISSLPASKNNKGKEVAPAWTSSSPSSKGTPRRGRASELETKDKTSPMPVATGNKKIVIRIDDDGDDDGDDDDAEIYNLEDKGSVVETSEVEEVVTEEKEDEPPDEFAIYVQQARERQALLESQRKGSTPGADDKQTAGATSGMPNAEASVVILVTSLIPNTEACMVRRKYAQPLGVVRHTFINWQANKQKSIPKELHPEIFLTWKGKRIYDTSSCDTLGVELDGHGRVRSTSYGGADTGYRDGGLHLQAWTTDLYAKHAREKEKEGRRRLGIFDDEDDEDDHDAGDDGVEAEEEPPEKVRITLQGKDYPPLQVSVYKFTTAETMVIAFRQKYDVPDSKDIGIYFDGERLDIGTTVEAAEIEDMDSLEVHVK
jgi:hypothetical protein